MQAGWPGALLHSPIAITTLPPALGVSRGGVASPPEHGPAQAEVQGVAAQSSGARCPAAVNMAAAIREGEGGVCRKNQTRPSLIYLFANDAGVSLVRWCILSIN
jgi:hypothetical protein